MRRLTTILGAFLIAAPILPSLAADPAPQGKTIVQPAIDGLLAAFKTHPLVGIGDAHGVAVEAAFYADLIRDPRFARDVGNVVVEFGASGQQAVIDRYVSGEAVPYTELRKVWADTVGWSPPAGNVGYAKFFAAVRAVNKSLPASRRIRIWLGEPAIDWPTATAQQVMAGHNARDSYPAELIGKNILAQRKKALVIYGGMHFNGGMWLRGRLDTEHPGALYVVQPYVSYNQPEACGPLLQQAMTIWPRVALASAAEGAVPEPTMAACATFKPSAQTAASQSNAVLFLAPLEAQVTGPVFPDYVLDIALRREMARRGQVGALPLIRFPPNYVLRKADYAFDLEAPGFAEAINAMFAEYDLNGDGQVTAAEYVDPIPR